MTMTASVLNEHKAATVRATYQAMLQWPHWEEVSLTCRKESPLSYEAFRTAVHAGDASRQAFNRAMKDSQMTREAFDRALPEFLKFFALYKAYDDIAMLGDGPDLIWHSLQLLDRYDAFCLQYLGFKVTHLPCSLYPLYGVELPTSSCVGKCVPSTCKGDGGGCKPDEDSLRRDTDSAEVTRERILAGRSAFVTSYTFVFGTSPDLTIWNVLDR